MCIYITVCFLQVAFTELNKQGRQTLQRDFPHSCTFLDVRDVLPEELRNNLDLEPRQESIDYEKHAPCDAHPDQTCSLPRNIDIAMFGAPCVDDSPMGALKKDNGKARKAALMTLFGLASLFR